MLTELFAIMSEGKFLRKNAKYRFASDKPWTDDPDMIRTYTKLGYAEGMVVRLRTCRRDKTPVTVVRFALSAPEPVEGTAARTAKSIARGEKREADRMARYKAWRLRQEEETLAKSQARIAELKAAGQ